MRRLAGAAILAVFAIVYSVLAFGNGIDRVSLKRSVDASMVPKPLQAQVLRQQAMASLQANQFDVAIEHARNAVLHAPLEPASSSMLGLAYYLAGKPAQAEAAFTVAGRLGWRDFPTQGYWLDRSLAQGDYQSAVARLDAIMRTNPQLPESRQWLTRIEAVEEARRELLIRLAEGPDWLGNYVASAGELDSARFAVRMDLIEATAAMGHRPGCQDSLDTINAMASRGGRYAEARRLWKVSCARERTSALIANSDFAYDQGELLTPFDWSLPGAGGLSSAIVNGRLELRNDTLAEVEAARQFVLLPPGRYRFGWQARVDGNAEALQRLVRLYCPGGNDLVAEAGVSAGAASGHFAAVVDVPAGCMPQRLAITAPENSGAIEIDAIEARPSNGGR